MTGIWSTVLDHPLLPNSHVATSVKNLDTMLKTVDQCCWQEATRLQVIIPISDSPSTSQQEVIQPKIIQSSEDDLAQVNEIVQKCELESGQSNSYVFLVTFFNVLNITFICYMRAGALLAPMPLTPVFWQSMTIMTFFLVTTQQKLRW